ncbi:MAG: hypothetical protein H6Q14_920 [Bacteroidetes bacterium]|nr:hypothetical protein [Bacteroidota bacterium]
MNIHKSLIHIKWIMPIFFSSFFICNSCKLDINRHVGETIVRKWIGKTIQLPDDFLCKYQYKDTSLCASLLGKEYRVLLYMDSTGCANCKFDMKDWKNLIEKVDNSDYKSKVGFLLFFQSKKNKIKELSYFLKRDNFSYPVFLDTANTINKLNHFPSNPAYQCFLLDRHNKVLAIGNPALNPKVWELYKRIISGDKQPAKQERTTTVEADKREYNYGSIKINKAHSMEFTLKNTGTSPLIISQVSASCGCTAVDWEKRPIPPGESTRIKVEMKPDNPGTFTKTITAYCNVERGCKGKN